MGNGDQISSPRPASQLFNTSQSGLWVGLFPEDMLCHGLARAQCRKSRKQPLASRPQGPDTIVAKGTVL